ncbi:MAG: sulfotransferase [Parcubacteria group bacterium]|nr:sulfotransferase [Parcubacteria group bacterium]
MAIDKIHIKTPIFIGGMSRSGTSLLLSLLDGHPEVLTVPFETRWWVLSSLQTKEEKIEYLLSQYRRFDLNSPSERKRILNYSLKLPEEMEWTRNFNYPLKNYARLDVARCRSLLKERVQNVHTDKEIVRQFISSFAEGIQNDKKSVPGRFVQKTPKIEFHYRLLQEWFGKDIFFVHMIRDPYDSFASFREFKRTMMYDANVGIEGFVLRYRHSCWLARIRTLMNKNYIVVRYEDLVKNPKHELQRIVNIIGIPFVPTLLIPSLNKVKWEGNSIDRYKNGDSGNFE